VQGLAKLIGLARETNVQVCVCSTVLFLTPWMARRTLIVGFPLAQYHTSSILQLLLLWQKF